MNKDIKLWDIFIGDSNGGYSNTCLALNKQLAVWTFMEDIALSDWNEDQLSKYVSEVKGNV